VADDEQDNDTKKKKRKRTPSRKANVPPGPIYPDNMPEGSDVPVNPRFAHEWGYDQESVRVNQVVRQAEKRRAAGETNVRWDGPDHIKFEQAKRESPHASIRFQQIEPVKDDNIPHKSFLQLDSWDKLVHHLATTHWNGRRARYKVYIYDSTNWQKAALEVNFNEREESESVPVGQQASMVGQVPNGFPGFPQQGFPQQGFPQGFPNPWGMGMPPMMNPMMWPMMQPQMMQPQMPQQQQAPQAQPQQPQQQMPQFPFPMSGSMDPNVVAMLMQLTRENASLVEEVRRAAQQQTPQMPQQQQMTPQMMMAYMMAYPWMFGMGAPPQQGQQPKEEPKPPEPPPDPIKQATAAMDLMFNMSNKAKSFAQKFADPEPPEPPPPPDSDADKLPHVIKELPHMRAVFDRETGNPVDAVTMAMYNGDKIADGFKGAFKEMRGMFKDFTDEKMRAQERQREIKQQEIDQGKQQLEQQEVALQQGERMAALTERMNHMGIQPGSMQNSPPVPPASPNGSGTTEPQ